MIERDDGHFGDLVGHVAQPQNVPAAQPRPLTSADVRERMVSLIATLRDADTVPFPPPEMKKHIAMFPIMAQWLDADEGRQLVFAFEAEVRRLLAA